MEITQLNAIKLGDKVIDLNPQNENDLTEITNAVVNIMGFILEVGTSGIKEDKERVEKIMTLAGNIGGAMAKQALLLIANNEKKEDPSNVGNA